ncbi:DUF6314 family protein [Marivita sp.]|uniref:DUF6314 family protein n=1 Tax=Marivita sp. TaxID=2003365 RepID=UPI003F6B8271
MKTQTAPRLGDFEGEWALSRRIVDHRAGSIGHFEGTAVFTRDGRGLAYRETGSLSLPGHPPMTAERRYHWREEDGQLIIEFDDGRFFHSFGSTTQSATHWCDPDTYRVCYDFSAWPVWQSTWDVSGPRKAYKMINSFRPLAG